MGTRDTADISLRDSALAAYERGADDALDKIAKALRRLPSDGGLLIADARARSAAGDPRAFDRLQSMLRRAPDWLDGHVALAQLRWEMGPRGTYLAEFEAALQLMPNHAGLWFRYINALAGSGASGRAADVARRLRGMGGDGPALRLIEAHHAGMAGELERSGALLASIPPEFSGKSLEEARHRLRSNDPAGAALLLDDLRNRSPLDNGGWALLELAWRACGDPRHAWLVDADTHIRSIELCSGAAELDTLGSVLRRIHHRGGRPLGQSVREGTQTRGNLWLRGEAELAALHDRLRSAVAEFAAGLSGVDADHPLRPCFDGPLELTTGWSVRLLGGGHHISHIHAHGVLSSACYIVVPPAAEDGEGWLEVGRPPADVPLDLLPLVSVEPRPGRLVLFPSYLYHGTRAFRSGERLTVAFDAAPGP